MLTRAAEVEPIVHIVDDDPAVRNALQFLVRTTGRRVHTYSTSVEFLTGYDPGRAGCLVLDVRMPHMSGLELLAKLDRDGMDIPTIVITGFGDVPMAVEAMKLGAVDFIEKPFRDQVLLDRIQHALSQDWATRQARVERVELHQRMAELTPRERQVMDHVVLGRPSKQIGAALGISYKTVEVHRSNMMKKMRARSVAQLVQLTLDAARPERPYRFTSPAPMAVPLDSAPPPTA
jgi:FixJ family two-component response regulator